MTLLNYEYILNILRVYLLVKLLIIYIIDPALKITDNLLSLKKLLVRVYTNIILRLLN